MTEANTVYATKESCPVKCEAVGVGKNVEIYVTRKKETDHEWVFLDVSFYVIGKLWNKAKEHLGYEINHSDSSLANFKNTWVSDNRDIIIEISNSFNLPPEIIAGIAWTEVGGSPDGEDAFVHDIRSAISKLNIGKPPEHTSVGDIQVQIRHIAGYLGFPNPNDLSYYDRLGLIKFIESERNNIYIVGRYISHNLKQVYPEYVAETLTDNDIVMIGFMYNMGYPHKLIGKDKDLSVITERGISRYGFDLLKKREKMKELLGIK